MKFHARNQGVLSFQTVFLILPTLTEISTCRKMKVQILIKCKVLYQQNDTNGYLIKNKCMFSEVKIFLLPEYFSP